MNPYQAIQFLIAEFEKQLADSTNGIAYKIALTLAIESLKRVRVFY